MRLLRVLTIPVAVLVTATVVTVTLAGNPAQGSGGASAVLKDPAGRVAGQMRIAAAGRNRVTVQAILTGASVLTPGFHGFHIHTTGSCVPPSFTSAGGHLGSTQGQVHDDHVGDMPSLLVKADGSALLVFETDRAVLDRVLDADGAAVVVHGGPDNFANIPERYGVVPDAITLATGDSGARALCGELR